MGTWGVGTFGFVTYLTTHGKQKQEKKMKVNAALEWEDVSENWHFILKVEFIHLPKFIYLGLILSSDLHI